MPIRRIGASRELKVNIPEEVYFRLEEKLTSRFTKKPIYGQRSQLITALIVEWLNKIEAQKETSNVPG